MRCYGLCVEFGEESTITIARHMLPVNNSCTDIQTHPCVMSLSAHPFWWTIFVSTAKWRHVPSKSNLADLVSRGAYAHELHCLSRPHFFQQAHDTSLWIRNTVALNRFVATRGLYGHLWCNNCTNFVGDRRDLDKLRELFRCQPDIISNIYQDGHLS